MPRPQTDFIVSLLDTKVHDRAAFSCGEPSLDEYLRKRAGQDRKRFLAITYVLAPTAEPARVAGYFTLSSYAILTKELPAELADRLPRHDRFPTTLVGRLARDESFRGEGLGELLLLEALARALESSEHIASYAVIVDALNEQAAAFYLRYGFMRLSADAQRLYMPMETIRALFT